MYGLDSIRRFQEGGFTDAQVAQYFAENPGISEAQIAEAMRITGVSPEQVARVTGADPGYVSQRYLDLAPAPAPAPAAVDPVAQKYVNDFNALINQGNYEDAARLVKSAELAGYGEEAYRAAAVALDANTNLPPELNFLNAEGIASIKSFVEQATRPPVVPPAVTVAKSFDEQLNDLANQNLGRSLTASEMETYRTDFRGELNDANISDFLKRSQKEIDQIKTARDTATKAADTAAANVEGRPGPDQILGIPRFERQTPSALTFAPLRRGIAQLRPAAFMPGLTSGQAPLGGSGFTPESLRTANQGLSPADRAYLMDVGGVSPAELSAAIGTPVGQLQAEYNQSRPGGLFGMGAPAPRGLPEDFVLQTGAYGAPTPTFFTPTPAKTTFPSGSSSAGVASNNFGGIGGDGGDGGDGDSSAGESATGDGTGADSDAGPGGTGTAGSDPGNDFAQGGDVEPTTPPKMSRLSASEAGSKFDISKFIDSQGRLVGGYSKPVYDENRVITGYEYQPYQRDVVFNPRLAEAEALGMSDEEREAARRGLIVRQGLTGVDPYAGGLAGIQAREAVMRNRPQYYSYAEGGLANAAQNLASRGRYGDSVLVHMAPEELSGLRALARAQGNDLTINPRTGLPEAFSLKKLFKAASFILPFIPIPGLFGMSSLLTRSILSGVAAGASAKGGFDLKQALGGGLKAYALGSLGEKLGGGPATPGGPTTTPTTPTTVPDAAAVNPMAGMENIEVPLSGQPALGPSVPIYEGSIGPAGGPDLDVRTPLVPGSVPEGGTVPGTAPTVITPEGQGFGKPITKGFDIAAAGIGGLSLEKAAEEQRSYEIEAAALKREDEERKRRFDELFARTLGSVRTAKAGGTINLAKGGMTYMEAGGTTGPTGTPRDVTGTGDGMSDSVPATIEGVQEARLADGEFVIPADVVADIGNGSSDAGSKKLYDMMDRIRKARHGTTKQPPEIKAERLMPA
jgi:hypothetical protein